MMCARCRLFCGRLGRFEFFFQVAGVLHARMLAFFFNIERYRVRDGTSVAMVAVASGAGQARRRAAQLFPVLCTLFRCVGTFSPL